MPLKDPAKKRAWDLRNRRRHAARVASGTCTRCGRLPPEPGLKTCRACAEKRRAADRARRARARQQGKPYAGRDPEQVEISVWPGSWDASRSLDLDLVRSYVEMGASRLIVSSRESGASSDIEELRSGIDRYQQEIIARL